MRKKVCLKHILGTYVKTINQTLRECLWGITDFNILIELQDKKIEFLIHQDGVSRELYRASGYQRFAASLAINYTMLKLTTINIPSFIFMDEIFPSVSESNMKYVENIIKKYLEIYETIFIISHNPSVVDWAINEKLHFSLVLKDQYSVIIPLDKEKIMSYKEAVQKIMNTSDITEKQKIEKQISHEFSR